MKSPAELAEKLTRQWQRADLREKRLLGADAWPLELPIGRPSGDQLANEPERVRAHLQTWRRVEVGEVVWEERRYRSAADPVSLPSYWRLNRPSEWVTACGDRQVKKDYALLSRLIEQTDPLLHAILIRQLPQLRELPLQEILQVARLALELEPGMAQGRPLRALPLGVDSKFFERNRRLLVHLLDRRFEGEVSARGLEAFLDAAVQDHWLLVAPLAPGLLPFEQQRVRAGELRRSALPVSHILVVENAQCLHLLPPLPDCIAILGAGLDLGWMQAPWLGTRELAYWGDLDTWGLAMLGRARQVQPHLQPLMMDRGVFDRFAAYAVVEPVPYRESGFEGLAEEEMNFLRYLTTLEKGRLEQEFLPEAFVAEQVRRWRGVR